jgi:viroplasmin and RNaseH domain-containing protein
MIRYFKTFETQEEAEEFCREEERRYPYAGWRTTIFVSKPLDNGPWNVLGYRSDTCE